MIPAHNEAAVIERLLESLNTLSYPTDAVDIFVVADNCTDATAVLARGMSAIVFERHDDRAGGKGRALNWLIGEAGRLHGQYDAYVVLDADSVVVPGFLLAMNRRLNAGDLVIQGYYTVLRLHHNRTEMLREAALALVHLLRPAAKNAIGASAGLKGNGMCFDRSVIEQFGWPSSGLAEDVEFHLQLVAAGLRVRFAPEAVVRAEMPGTLAHAQSQNARWEAGRTATLRRQAWPLLCRGLRTRNVAAIDAAVEQFVPPLSAPVAVIVGGLIGGLLFGLPAVWLTAAILGVMAGLYILTGLVLARVPPRVYGALLHAPVYMLWKLMIYGAALAGRRDRTWVRTQRAETR
jgi:cellulose synthase/poly-beta-1,6-N-acetylglucosamine synthase-like glycosyltransferase